MTDADTYAHPDTVGDHGHYEDRLKRAYKTADRSGQPQMVHRHTSTHPCDPDNPCTQYTQPHPRTTVATHNPQDLDTLLGPDPGTFPPYPPRDPAADRSAAVTAAFEALVRRLPDATQRRVWDEQHRIWIEGNRTPHDRRLRLAIERIVYRDHT